MRTIENYRSLKLPAPLKKSNSKQKSTLVYLGEKNSIIKSKSGKERLIPNEDLLNYSPIIDIVEVKPITFRNKVSGEIVIYDWDVTLPDDWFDNFEECTVIS